MERTILSCQVILTQILLLLSNLQSLLIRLCTGPKQAICSRPLSKRIDCLPYKALYFSLSVLVLLNVTGVYVVGGDY